MSDEKPMGSASFLSGVFLVSLTVLCFEVALSFELAYIFWFYLSFIVIAVAMFGIGVGSVLGYFIRKRYAQSYFRILHYSALGAGAGMIVSLLVTVTVSKANLGTDLTSEHLLEFIIFSLVILGSSVVPFVFSGMFLSLGLNYPSSEKRFISFIYFADLLGAGIGAFLISALLPLVSVEEVIALCGLVAILASMIFLENVKIKNMAAILPALFVLGVVFAKPVAFSPLPMGGKFLTVALERGATLLDTQWTSVSRVDVIEYQDKGLRRFVENGEYPITISSGNYENLHRGLDPRWAMFYKKPESMLAIGSGGGVELTMALHEGVSKIQAVEINPFIIEYMKNEMTEFSNGLYFNPNIDTVIEDGRTFIHRSNDRYDLIENGVLGSAGLVVPSTSMLTTKDMSVYTVEANQEYIRHLSDQGMAVTVIYGLLDNYNVVDRERGVTAMVLKQYNTVKEALVREGMDPTRHFMMFRYVQRAGNFQDDLAQAEYTFLFKKEVTRADVLELIAVAEEFGLQPLYAPFYEDSLDIEAAISNLPENKDVSWATDNRPFFYFTDKSLGLILLAALAFLFILTFLFIILPIALQQGIRLQGPNLAMIVFFLSIGVGYILIEATLIQKLVLFLGRPSYAFQVVLFSMLIFSGLGSMTTGSFIKREESVKGVLVYLLLIIFILVTFYSGLVQSFVLRFIHLDLPLKILLTMGLISLPAFIMGMPFPLGLRFVSHRDPYHVIWMYGVNSSGSVLASVIGMYVALYSGFSYALLLGGLLYGLALIAILLAREVTT
jgi:hypothetical protein